ncbi:MAG: hypothetical protein WA208_17915, partial [Thermoanaerobaculia bacterium]
MSSGDRHRAVRVALCLLLIPALLSAQYVETIVVSRIIFDVRVTDGPGDPILGLTAEDFTVEIGGKRATVESATWVPDTVAARAVAAVDEPEPVPAGPEEQALPDGRLIIVFIQTDFARNTERIRGQMGFLTHAKAIVEALEPHDRVAVFSFDSHLKFRLDFTADKERVGEVIAEAMKIDLPPPPPIVPNPALARRLDRDAMRAATDSEGALILIGNALRPIPGPKSMLLLGWGLGEMVGGRVYMKSKYEIAKRTLEAARVTVFALDTTYAEYHSLEVGLSKAAKDTGGFYAKTHVFPQLAVERLQRTLAGHYELEVRRPEGIRPGAHAVT